MESPPFDLGTVLSSEKFVHLVHKHDWISISNMFVKKPEMVIVGKHVIAWDRPIKEIKDGVTWESIEPRTLNLKNTDKSRGKALFVVTGAIFDTGKKTDFWPGYWRIELTRLDENLSISESSERVIIYIGSTSYNHVIDLKELTIHDDIKFQVYTAIRRIK